MPYNRHTLQTLIDRNQTNIEARLPGADARLRHNVLDVLARMEAAGEHGLYGALEFYSKQFFPDTAEAEFLDRWAILYLDDPRLAPFAASGSITFTGSNGSVIIADTVVQTSNGVQYTTQTEVTITGGSATVDVICKTAGALGNLDAGAALTLLVTISGVNSAATVAVGGIDGGADQESDARLLQRIIERMQQPPHGGATFDYIAWAKAAHPAVTRVWVTSVGTEITVRITTDDEPGGIIPAQQVIDAVQAYIDNVRPLGAEVTVEAPGLHALDLTIELTPNTSLVQNAVSAELVDMLRRTASPGGIIALSKINESISIAEGEDDHTIVSPVGDVQPSSSDIVALGTITWQ